MHAIISARELFDHVKMVAHATITNSRAIPILRCVKLTADGDKVTVTATNLEIVAEATTVATAEAAGEAVVPAEPLTGVLTGITGDLEIIADETEVVLKHGRSRFRLPALPVEDFPDPLGVAGDVEGVGLSAADLARFTSASLLTAVDDRIYLAGVLVHAEDGHLTVTGTDAAALLHDAVDAVYRGPDVIVHFDTIKMLGRLFGKSGATMRTNGKLIEFSSDSVRLVSKLIDSRYPDYTRIIPTQVPVPGVTVASAEIAAAFARFAAFRTGKNELQCAVLTWDADAAPGELHLTLNRSQAGEGEVIITAETTGAGRTGVGVNKMSGLLTAVDVQTVRIGRGSPDQPVLMTSPERPAMKAFLMPMWIPPLVAADEVAEEAA